MPSLDGLKPRLKPCLLYRDGAKLILEEKATHRHFLLEPATAPIVERFDGTHTLGEIAAKLHQLGISFRFRDLIETAQALQRANFLEKPQASNEPSLPNEEASPRSGFFDSWHQWVGKLRVARVLIPRIVTPIRSSDWYYPLTTLIFALGLLSGLRDHYFIPFNQFGVFQDSYFLGLVFLLLGGSALLSIKAVLQAFLQLLATGRVYGFGFKVSRFTVHFTVSDAAIYLSRGKAGPLFFHLASAVMMLATVGVGEIWLGHHLWFPQLKTLAFFLTLPDLSPYVFQSDVHKALHLFQSTDLAPHLLGYLKKKALTLTLSKEKKRLIPQEFRLALFATYALSWSSLSLYFALSVLSTNFPNLWIGVMEGRPWDKLSASLVLGGVSLWAILFLIDLVGTLYQSWLSPWLSPLREKAQAARAKKLEKSLSQSERLSKILQESALFQGLTQETLGHLLSQSSLQEIPEDSFILKQDQKNEDLAFLISGQARVIRTETSGAETEVAVLPTGAVVGETSALQGLRATANVLTLGTCQVLRIPAQAVQSLPESGETLRDRDLILTRVLLGNFLSASAVFKNLPREALTLFSQRGRIVELSAGQIVTRQGDLDASFYLILRGWVEVIIDDSVVTSLGQGEFFGEIALFAGVPRTATIRCVGPCLLLRLESGAFWEILSTHLPLSAFIESVAEKRMTGKAA